MSSGTASALTSTGPRRARAAAIVAGGLPDSKITEVLALVNTQRWPFEEHFKHSRSCPASYGCGGDRGTGELSDI